MHDQPQPPSAPPATDRPASARRGQVLISGALLLALTVIGIALITRSAPANALSQAPPVPQPRATTAGKSATDVAPTKQPSQPTPEPVDPRRTLALGNWVGYYQGQRTLVLRADGTGTMTSEPEGIAATLLAAKLTFEIQWKLHDQQVVFETISGEPASKVAMVTRMFGKHRQHDIRTLTAEEMVLLDEDGKTEYTWTRVKPEAPPGM